jgi:hypothetical protein
MMRRHHEAPAITGEEAERSIHVVARTPDAVSRQQPDCRCLLSQRPHFGSVFYLRRKRLLASPDRAGVGDAKNVSAVAPGFIDPGPVTELNRTSGPKPETVVPPHATINIELDHWQWRRAATPVLLMFFPEEQVRIFLYGEPISMRLAFDGL